MQSKLSVSLFSLLFIFQLSFAQLSKPTPDQQLARDIFEELIAIDTYHSTGNTTVAAEAMAKRLKSAGYAENDVAIVGPNDRNKNLVVRLHGTGKNKPILFLSHLDVVEARREDWSYDPNKLTESEGYFYGRGALDMKESVAILVANFIRMKREGYQPDRDLILALTAGEETGGDYNGVYWLVKNQRQWIDAAFCINLDAGEPQMQKGKRILRPIQASEKGVLNLTLEVKNPGGHGSLPTKDNAIYRLSSGLVKMQAFDFPFQLNEQTKSYFEKMSTIESGQVAIDMKSITGTTADKAAILRLSTFPYYNGLMRTTCVATMVEAGHAINALPQSAKATINCRVLPGVSQNEVLKTMTDVLADSQIVISVLTELINNPPSVIQPEFIQTVQRITDKLWPGVPIIQVMGVGASDGKYLRREGIPTFGVSGVFLDVDDSRMHGKDERIQVKDFYDGLKYNYVLIHAFSK